jgi:hypothetical protein
MDLVVELAQECGMDTRDLAHDRGPHSAPNQGDCHVHARVKL